MNTPTLDPEQLTAEQQRLTSIYKYLAEKNIKNFPATLDEFKSRMADDEELSHRVHTFLSGQNIKNFPTDYVTFQTALGLKKKDAGYPVPSSIVSSNTPPPEDVQRFNEWLKGPRDPNQTKQGDPDFVRLEAERKAGQEAWRQAQDNDLRLGLGIDKPEKETNPVKSFAKSIWNTLSQDVPGAMAAAGSMALKELRQGGYGYPDTPPASGEFLTSMLKGDGTVAGSDDTLSPIELEMLNYANKAQFESAETRELLVSRIKDVKDPIDALNWVSATIGSAAAQIPLSIVSGGSTSIGQEIGSIYLESVNRIASERGLTIEQVIDQGLDNPGVALAWGAAAGTLDYIGAKSILGSSKDGFARSLRSRALIGGATEGGTEYTQTFFEQMGQAIGSGKTFSDAFVEAGSDEKASERLEALAAGVVSGPGVHAGASVAMNLARRVKQNPTATPQQAPEETSTTPPSQHASPLVSSKDGSEGIQVQAGLNPESGKTEFTEVDQYARANTKEEYPVVPRQSPDMIKGDVFDYVPNKTLPEDQKQIESNFAAKLNKEYDSFRTQYQEKFGNVIDADYVKELSPEYNADQRGIASAVHNPSSSFAHRMYLDALKEPAQGKENKVTFVVGGAASGKTMYIENSGVKQTSQIVYPTLFTDLTLSKNQINRALNAGKDVEIKFIDRDQQQSYRSMVSRAEGGRRIVPDEVFVKSHENSRTTIDQLQKEYAGNGRVKIEIVSVDNPQRSDFSREANIRENLTQQKVSEDTIAQAFKASETVRRDPVELIKKLDELGVLLYEDLYGERLDIGVDKRTRQDALRNIREGNLDRAPIKKLIAAVQVIQESGDLPFVSGSGGTVFGKSLRSLEELIAIHDQVTQELEEQEAKGEIALSPTVLSALNAGVTKDNLESLKAELFNGFPFTEEDYNEIKKHYEKSERESAGGIQSTEEVGDRQSDNEASQNARIQEGLTQPAQQQNPDQEQQKFVGLVQPAGMNFRLPFDLTAKLYKIEHFFKEWISPRSLMPQSMYDLTNRTKANTAMEMLRLKMYVSDLDKAIKKDFGSKVDLVQINDALQGTVPVSKLPADTAHAVKQMRDQITLLQQKGIRDGVFTGDLIPVIKQSEGTYLTRSYRVHDIPEEWARYLTEDPQGQAIMNQAEAFIKSKLKTGNLFPAQAAEEAQGIIKEILYNPDAPLAILKAGKLGSKDVGILRKRQDIAPEIRALMGEWKDPFVNYSKTIVKMVNLINNHNFQRQLRADGLNRYFFERPIGKHFAKVATKGSNSLDALTSGKDLYTTPDIAKMIEQYYAQDTSSAIWKTLAMFNAYAKLAKTVLSTSTHARNFEANSIFYLANGYAFDLSINPIKGFLNFTNAAKATGRKLAQSKVGRDRLLEYVELEVVGGSVQAGEIQSYIDDFVSSIDDPQKFYGNRLKKIRNRSIEKVAELYQAEDDFWRIVAFETELDRYTKAFAGDPSKTPEQIRRLAADRVIGNLPTYSRAPKLVRKLGQTVFVAPFATFSAEVLRTGYNTIASIKQDWNDPKTRPIAIKRVAGVLVAIAIVDGIREASKYFFGITDDEEDAVSKIDSPWSTKSKAFTGRDSDGNITYIDMGYTDPFTYVREPARLLLDGATGDADLRESAIQSLKLLAAPYMNEGLLTQKLIDIARNKTPQGADVYNPELPIGDQIRQMSDHLWKGFEPGTVRSARRIIQAHDGEVNQYGKKIELGDELMFMVGGQRAETIQPTQAIQNIFKYDLKVGIDNADRIFEDVYYRKGTVTAQELENAKNRSEVAVKRNLDEGREFYQAAIVLGVTQKDLFLALEAARIDKFDRAYIMGKSDTIYRKNWLNPRPPNSSRRP